MSNYKKEQTDEAIEFILQCLKGTVDHLCKITDTQKVLEGEIRSLKDTVGRLEVKDLEIKALKEK